MKSPITGKQMPIQVSKADLEFRGEHFWVWQPYYYCRDSKTQYRDDNLDQVILNQVYEQYAEKHNLPLEC